MILRKSYPAARLIVGILLVLAGTSFTVFPVYLRGDEGVALGFTYYGSGAFGAWMCLMGLVGLCGCLGKTQSYIICYYGCDTCTSVIGCVSIISMVSYLLGSNEIIFDVIFGLAIIGLLLGPLGAIFQWVKFRTEQEQGVASATNIASNSATNPSAGQVPISAPYEPGHNTSQNDQVSRNILVVDIGPDEALYESEEPPPPYDVTLQDQNVFCDFLLVATNPDPSEEPPPSYEDALQDEHLQLAVSERASSVVGAGNGTRQLEIAPPPYDEDMPQSEQDSPRLYVLVHI
ncbi:uncharacterized protein LOC111325934 [Stylophora pistillata]|uniref:uncharacterized protein LOC111325934 n=1 Tax=Stylophora pistillata TaxID=50429 RepID=UPI000C0495EC|nr:uncharacterized protein LOC111325934 [Stylophora pistillata]